MVIETVIQDNVLIGTAGVGQLTAGLLKPVALDVVAAPAPAAGAAPAARGALAAVAQGQLMTYDLRIERNVFVCWLTGVSLEGLSIQLGDTRIGQNSLLVCLRAAIVTTGITGAGGRIDTIANIVRAIGYGIVAGTSDTRIDDNDVGRLQGLGATEREGSLVSLSSGFAAAGGTSEAVLELFGGAAIVLAPGIRDGALDRCQVRGNRVTGVVGDAISIRTLVASALIGENQVSSVGGAGVAMSGRGAAEVLAVERNQVLDVGLLRGGSGVTAAGIQLGPVRELSVSANTVQGVGVPSLAAAARWGIAVDSCRSITITGNTVSGVGPTGEFTGMSAGIVVLDAFQRADILDNGVRRSDSDKQGQPFSRWYGILVGASGKGLSTATGAFTVATEAETIVFLPLRGELARYPSGTGSLAVRGNVVEAYGETPAVLLETSAACLFNDNRCFLTTSQGVPTARVSAGAAVASNNYLRGLGKLPGLELTTPAGAPFTVLGNISAGGISVNAAPLPAPWDVLNQL